MTQNTPATTKAQKKLLVELFEKTSGKSATDEPKQFSDSAELFFKCVEQSFILVSHGSHEYRVSDVSIYKAVFNKKHYNWMEYAGDDYLEDDDEVRTVIMVE